MGGRPGGPWVCPGFGTGQWGGLAGCRVPRDSASSQGFPILFLAFLGAKLRCPRSGTSGVPKSHFSGMQGGGPSCPLFGGAKQKSPKPSPMPVPLPPPCQGHGDAAGVTWGDKAPTPPPARGPLARGRARRWAGLLGEGGKIWIWGSGGVCPPSPAPLAPGPGSRLPLRAFLGEARGAGLGVCVRLGARRREGRGEEREGEGRGGRGAVEKSHPGPPRPPPRPGAGAPGPPPAALGVRRGEEGGAAGTPSPAPLHRRGPACGERNPWALPPLFPSPPSSLPPSFLPSPGLSRGGRGALPAVRLHACPPGRRWAPACPRPPPPSPANPPLPSHPQSPPAR